MKNGVDRTKRKGRIDDKREEWERIRGNMRVRKDRTKEEEGRYLQVTRVK